MKKTRQLFTTVTMIVIAAMMLSTSAFAATGEATVNSHMLNMREGQGMEYTIIDVAYEGDTVYVTQDDGSGWVQVSYNGSTGYMNKLFLTSRETVATQTYSSETVQAVQSASAQPASPVALTGRENATILGEGVYLRSGPSIHSPVLETLYTGTAIVAAGACGDWYEVFYNNQTGYVYGDYVVLNGNTVTYTVTAATVNEAATVYTEPTTAAPAQTTQTVTVEVSSAQPAAVQTPAPAATAAPAAIPAPTAAPANVATVSSNVSGQAIVNTAMQYIGTPYVWAGTSPEVGFDCSGLVYYVYGQYGISLNRVAQAMYYNGTAADLNNLQPGDILLFGSSVYNIWHAGIYIGNGQFIHAPHSGAVVSTQSIAGTYGMRLVAARRIF